MRDQNVRKNNRRWLFSMILAVAWGFVSCDRAIVYYHYEHAPVAGWDKNDTLLFDVSPLTAGSYMEQIGLRINGDYPFTSLCLVIKQTILPSGYVHSDTLNCSLADKDGVKKGTGLSYYQYLFHFNTLRLHDGDSLHISVRHNMKREMMPGVSDIGISLRKEK